MFDPAAGNNSALLITEQVLVFAVFVGSVAALPAFIEFITEMRKRKERIALSLEDEVAGSLRPRVAGMDDLLNSIADLIGFESLAAHQKPLQALLAPFRNKTKSVLLCCAPKGA